MAQHETREIVSYRRDGSLWIGRFVVSDGELNFGDDRFDAAHGLANFVCAAPMSLTSEAAPRVQTWNGLEDQMGGRKVVSVSKSGAVVEQLKLAA